MKQQLFLFEPPEEEAMAPIEAAPSGELPEAADEPAATLSADIEAPGEAVVPNEAEDPFAIIEQQRREEIENRLLLPKKKRGRKTFKDMDEEAELVEVPPDDILFKKQYYNTRTVAEWFNVTGTQLIKWEAEFDILKPKKNARGDRFFRPEDVKNLELIYHLIRRRKFTTEGARQYLKENKKGLRDTMQLIETLTKFKQFLTELKAISE